MARIFDETRKIQKPPTEDVRHAKELNKWLHPKEKVKYIPCGICGFLAPDKIYGYTGCHITCRYTIAGKRFIKLEEKAKKQELVAKVPTLI